jgi:hypothetical protein
VQVMLAPDWERVGTCWRGKEESRGIFGSWDLGKAEMGLIVVEPFGKAGM